MRILFIKPKHIGDSLILTPTIVATKRIYPDAEIWVLVRRGCEEILAGCPEITHILTTAPVEEEERAGRDILHELGTLVRLWKVRFDYVFELGDGHNGRLFAVLVRSQRVFHVKPEGSLSTLERWRCTAVSSFDWRTCHRVEKDYSSVTEFIDLPRQIPPLRFVRSLTRIWPPARDLTDFVVVQIGTRQKTNKWNREGWHAVCRHLLERHEAVVVSSGPVAHEIEEAEWLLNELGPRILCTRGEAEWAELADLLYRANLYVGVNTAAMHLAAACGCPVVALFGPSLEDYWYPWQVPYRIVTSHGYTPSRDTVLRYADIGKRLMGDIRLDDVIAACEALTARTPEGASLRGGLRVRSRH